MIKGITVDFYDVLYDSTRREIDLEVLNILKGYGVKGIPLVLFTNSSIKFLYSEDEKVEFLSIFSKCISTQIYNCKKPEEKAFEVLISEIDLNPREVIFVDDKLENILKAKKFGFETIQYISSVQLRKELNNLDIIT